MRKELTFLLVGSFQRDRQQLREKIQQVHGWSASFYRAENYSDAREVLTDQAVDLAFIDQRLAGKTGLEVVLKLRNANIDAPIILVGDDNDVTLPTRAIQGGADIYLSRWELRPAAVRQTVEYVLGRATEAREMRDQLDRYRRLSETDELTGLLSRRHWLQLFKKKLREVAKSGGDCHFVLLDLDNFKLLNDVFGHVRGDQLLTELGDLLREVPGESGIAGRFGGDEFCLVFLNWKPENIREKLHELALETDRMIRELIGDSYQKDLGVRLSMGVADFKAGESVERLIDRADQALSRVKKSDKYVGFLSEEKIEAEGDPGELTAARAEWLQWVKDRAHSRRELRNCAAQIKVDGREIPGEVLDFSSRGLKLATSELLPEGAGVEVEIDGEGVGIKPVELSGKVCWKRVEVGLEVEGIDGAELRK